MSVTSAGPRIVGISLDHPSARDRAAGEKPKVTMRVDRDLNSGRLDAIPLTEDDLIRVIAQASKALAILHNVPGAF